MRTPASSQPPSASTLPGAERQSLFFSSSLKAGVLVIRPKGPNLGQREAAIINSEVRPMIENLGRRLRTMVLDLSDVHGMASFGLGVCIELRNAAHAAKARTIVYGLNEELAAMFRLMKVERLYTIVQSTDELSRALAA